MNLNTKTESYSASSIAKNLPTRRYRPELHGVRGLAILGVVLFHLFGNGRVSGGIDIFLTISGFLFTAMLLREVTENDGIINLVRYFGRLFRRIFIPAVIVIVFTVAVGLVIFPFTQHSQVWNEALASLLYFENIELIRSHLAYEAAGQEISPFQHFWSLSIQGQFYLLWPFVALFAYWAARQFKTNVARVMTWILAAVLVVSLLFAVYVGTYAQDEAYLMTRTRVWQFAFGGLLAIVIDRIRLQAQSRFILGYVGLILIITVGFVLDGADLFPGLWALWPLLGFALVLISAPDKVEELPHRWSAPKVLSNRLFDWIGDHAYGLYLWHWPLLIFYLAVRDREAVGIRGALVIFAGTVVLSILMHKFVEEPLGRLGRVKQGLRLNWWSITAGVTVAAMGAVIALSQVPQGQSRTVSTLEFDVETYPGALTVTSGVDAEPETPIPELEALADSHPDAFYRGCQQTHGENPGSDEIEVCDDPDKPENPTAKVVLAGGSHAVHWEVPVRILGQEFGWEVLVVSKPACVFKKHENSQTPMCDSWNDNFMTWAEENEVDLVITPGTRVNAPESSESVTGGAPERWQEITNTGADLLLMRGTPRTATDPGECLAEGNSADECGAVVGDLANANPIEQITLADGAETIDMSEYVCPTVQDGENAICSAVIGNVIVRYDGSHMPTEYTRTLTPALEREMSAAFPQYFE